MCYIISHREAFWLCYNLGSERLTGVPRTGEDIVEEAACTTGDLDGCDLSRFASLFAPPAWLLGDAAGKPVKTDRQTGAPKASGTTRQVDPKQAASSKPGKRVTPNASKPTAEARARHDVLVPDRVGGRPGGTYLRHRWDGDLPEDALLDLGGGICASSPELCVLQLAAELDDVQLLRYAMALCAN